MKDSLNVFVIHSSKDNAENVLTEKLAEIKKNVFSFNPLMLGKGKRLLWKKQARKKIQQAQMVVFYVGEESHESPYIGWELQMAYKCKKPIYTILLQPGNKRHEALVKEDEFSGKKDYYDQLKTQQELIRLMQDFENGGYDLFNQPVQQLDKQLLLEQYKVFLQTSEDLIVRRQNVNNFYISLNSAMVALFTGLLAIDFQSDVRVLVGLVFAIMGIALSVSWIKTLVGYGNLNGSKMKIISMMEKQLPASMYDAEWAALSDRLNKNKYVSFTENEKRVPYIFIAIFILIFILILFSFLFS